jgi:hypothetical protein
MMFDLFVQLGLDGVEQVAIDDCSLFASENLTLEGHIPNVEAIAQQMGQRPAREWNAANGLTSLQGTYFGDDVAFAKVRHQQVEAAELEVAAENSPDPFRLGFVDGYLATSGAMPPTQRPLRLEAAILSRIVEPAAKGHLGLRSESVWVSPIALSMRHPAESTRPSPRLRRQIRAHDWLR